MYILHYFPLLPGHRGRVKFGAYRTAVILANDNIPVYKNSDCQILDISLNNWDTARAVSSLFFSTGCAQISLLTDVRVSQAAADMHIHI